MLDCAFHKRCVRRKQAHGCFLVGHDRGVESALVLQGLILRRHELLEECEEVLLGGGAPLVASEEEAGHDHHLILHGFFELQRFFIGRNDNLLVV